MIISFTSNLADCSTNQRISDKEDFRNNLGLEDFVVPKTQRRHGDGCECLFTGRVAGGIGPGRL
jgi:hypothetical protein